MAKPEDNGVSHNAYDEVRFLFQMISLDIDPEGLTWHEANLEKSLKDVYDKNLVKYGYNPIHHKGSSSSIHGGLDWTAPIRSKHDHPRDIETMKWKLYILCLKKFFTKEQFEQLEKFSSDQL